MYITIPKLHKQKLINITINYLKKIFLIIKSTFFNILYYLFLKEKYSN